MSIAGLTHAVSQQGRPATPCTFELSPTTGHIGKDAATGTFAVNAPSGCAWSASSNASWLTISGNSTGSGNGTVTYAASRNLSAADRAAVVTVADRAFTLSQSGDLGVCRIQRRPRERQCVHARRQLHRDGHHPGGLPLDGGGRCLLAGDSDGCRPGAAQA